MHPDTKVAVQSILAASFPLLVMAGPLYVIGGALYLHGRDR